MTIYMNFELRQVVCLFKKIYRIESVIICKVISVAGNLNSVKYGCVTGTVKDHKTCCRLINIIINKI
jgi:hypothetical protein